MTTMVMVMAMAMVNSVPYYTIDERAQPSRRYITTATHLKYPIKCNLERHLDETWTKERGAINFKDTPNNTQSIHTHAHKHMSEWHLVRISITVMPHFHQHDNKCNNKTSAPFYWTSSCPIDSVILFECLKNALSTCLVEVFPCTQCLFNSQNKQISISKWNTFHFPFRGNGKITFCTIIRVVQWTIM